MIGILPERRKDPRRITKESVLKWGRMLLDESSKKKNIIIRQMTIDDITHHVLEVDGFQLAVSNRK